MPRTRNMTGKYESDDIEVTFAATYTPPLDDEMDCGPDDIEVEEATILGVTVTRADVPPALWAAIEGLADMVEFEGVEE